MSAFVNQLIALKSDINFVIKKVLIWKCLESGCFRFTDSIIKI
jgi:hypothetical protein